MKIKILGKAICHIGCNAVKRRILEILRSPQNNYFSDFRKKLIKLLISAIACLLVGCQSVNPQLTVELHRVVSGQTLEIKLAQESANNLQQVRLIGIIAPDLRQDPWGVAAKDYLKTLLKKDSPSNSQNSIISLELGSPELDTYNRKLAYIWYGGKLINEQLVEQGYVLAETRFDHKYRQRLINAQEYARIMGLGIWNPQNPMTLTPQEFRSQN